ncbi:MAG: transposase [Deltaproteobacteria bacterium]|nr:transposase [Deltaproteobacteria bacterium]
MARPLRIEYEGGFYHVTSRGNERRKIFYGSSDYEKFKAYLREAQEKYGYLLHSYVLMSNHYHLLIETPQPNLSQVMHLVNGSYTNYFNRKRGRSGHLFQGRYKAILIERDSYLLELSRYIHLNPVRAELVTKPEDYPYSSYGALIAKRKESFVCRDLIWKMISGEKGGASQRYKVFVEGGMVKKSDSPLKDVYGGAILGGERFIKEALGRINGEVLHKEEVSHRRELKTSCGVEEMIRKICEHLKMPFDELMREKGENRKMLIYLAKKFTGMTNRQIADLLGGITCSAVAKTYERFSLGLEENRALSEKLESLSRQLSNVKG